jgi:hypothetical protein
VLIIARFVRKGFDKKRQPCYVEASYEAIARLLT